MSIPLTHAIRVLQNTPVGCIFDRVTIGEKLRELRESRKISRVKVGEVIGVKYQTIQKYEKDEVELKLSHLVAIAAFFKVGVGYFFEDNYQAPPCLITNHDPHAAELGMAKDVLASNTHYADSLKMNIHSFHKAVEKERALEMRVAHVEKTLEDLSPPGGALPFVKHSDSSMKRKRKLPE